MNIELRGRKIWGSGYSHRGKTYGDSDWKEKIKTLVLNQDFVVVEGRYGNNNHDYHFLIKGFPFSLISKDDFLEKLDKIIIGFGDDVYLYDIFQNMDSIWSKKHDITEKTRYIFVSHTATKCQMF